MADWQSLARRTAQEVGIPPNLFVALVRQESGGRNVTNPRSGATGPTQLMPATAHGLGVDPHNYQQNLLGGARYLKQQLRAFGGSVPKALAAYNAGPGAVQKYHGIPPYAETQNYVKAILANAGHVGAVSGGRVGAVSGGTAPAPAASSLGGGFGGVSADPGGGVDVSALLETLQNQRRAPSASTLQAPSYAAGPTMPAGYQALTSSVGPGPRPDIGKLLSLVRTQGGGDTTSTSGGAGATGAVSDTGAPQAPSDASGGTQGSIGAKGAVTAALVQRANQIDAAHLPYKWGGGHGGKVNPSKPVPLDCSGAVSAVLGINPRVSGQFESFGRAGDGGNRGVTIYANSHHVLMKIDGHFFGTSQSNPGGGAGWIPQHYISPQYLKGFTVRHL